jgi:hypothetical protein
MAGPATPPEVVAHSHPDESGADALARTVMVMPVPGGQPAARPAESGGLDPGTRAFFECRFGVDLGHVRVHADPVAAQSAARLGAVAYTVGTDIVMGAGQQVGPNLVTAHELAHVVRGDAVGRICRAPAGGFAIISDVWRVADRDIVLVATDRGNQVLSFYRRTGLGYKGVGVAPPAESWVPFKTLMEHPEHPGTAWFNKNPYYTTVGPEDPLRGYANTLNRDVGAWLDGQHIPSGVEAESWETVEQEMDQVAARYRASTPGEGASGAGPGPGGSIEGLPGEGAAFDVPIEGMAGEDLAIGERLGVMGVSAVGELDAMLSFATWWLVLPLALDILFSYGAEQSAEAERQAILKAFIAAWPLVMTGLRQRQAELDQLMQQAREGQTVYANVRFRIQPPEVGAGRGSYDPEPEKPELKLFLIGIDLSTAKMQRRDGNDLVISIPLYKQEVDPSVTGTPSNITV